jgi:hypothetical protein
MLNVRKGERKATVGPVSIIIHHWIEYQTQKPAALLGNNKRKSSKRYFPGRER